MNYKQLSAIHVRLAKSGLNILAFPCNQFGGQEPGTHEDIKQFAAKYNAEFQMFSKIDVNGAAAHPAWAWLKTQKGGWFGSSIKWNFSKFLVGPDGKVIKRYSPQTKPDDIMGDINKAMATMSVSA